MNSTLSAIILLLLLARAALAQLPPVEAARAWKTAEGQPFKAALQNFDGTTAFFRMPNGRPAQSPAAKLSAEDQQYLAEWKKRQPIKYTMPDIVGVDTATLKTEVVSEDAATSKFVYRTAHFEFESEGKFKLSLLREVARDFEATYELVKALPWNIGPKPPSGNYFRAHLFKDLGSYRAAGGPINSGGVYDSRKEMFLVPFESIGVKPLGTSFVKSEDFDSSTMVHELTHQMMHFWLDFLPVWVAEGTAEYTSALPLHAGRFRVAGAKTGLKNYLDDLKKRSASGVPEPYPLEKLLNVTNDQWMQTLSQDPTSSHRMYLTSYLLVYYFMHLDGKGDAQRFLRYFREVQGQRKEMEDYRKAMEEFFQKPGVQLKADGSYTYRSDIPHPPKPAFIDSPSAQAASQKKMLAILLDERSEDELMKQIRSAYRQLGIKL
jgi:hypothetical protein